MFASKGRPASSAMVTVAKATLQSTLGCFSASAAAAQAAAGSSSSSTAVPGSISRALHSNIGKGAGSSYSLHQQQEQKMSTSSATKEELKAKPMDLATGVQWSVGKVGGGFGCPTEMLGAEAFITRKFMARDNDNFSLLVGGKELSKNASFDAVSVHISYLKICIQIFQS
jgi:hypothetical protein